MKRSPKGTSGRKITESAKKYQIMVFTEGKKTEPIYLGNWHRIFRDRVVVTISDFHADPFSLVREAAAQKEREERSSRKGRGDAYDEYWCVFDVDEHPNIPQAVDLAKKKEISLAISNPCIELWFALHFRSIPTYIDRHRVQREMRDLLKCEKVLSVPALEQLVARYEAARDRAVRLDEKHGKDGSKPGENPSTRIWALVDAIKEKKLRSR